jgi:serine/threonine protein kinase
VCELPKPAAKAIEYADQILDALDAAHREGMTHSDLKPACILVTKQGVKAPFGYVNRLSGVRMSEPM